MMTSKTGALDRGALFEIGQTPLFNGLPEADMTLLLEGAFAEAHPDGVILYSRDQPADRFFVMLDGHVELFLEEGGRRRVFDVAQRPSVLGESALFGEGRYPTSARVIGYAKLLVVPSAPFLAALDGRFDLAMRMLGSMSVRLRGLVATISDLKMKSTAQRLTGFLLGLTPKTEGPAVVRFPYDKRLAADNLGMTAETLSRALLRLANLGVESRADNLVAIAELGVLRQFCAEDEG